MGKKTEWDLRGVRYRIYPNAEQAEELLGMINKGIFVWNYLIDFGKHTKRKTGKFGSPMEGIKALRVEKRSGRYAWLEDLPGHSLDEIRRQLDFSLSSYFALFKKYKAGEIKACPHPPGPRDARRSRAAFPFRLDKRNPIVPLYKVDGGSAVSTRYVGLQLPKVSGLVRLLQHQTGFDVSGFQITRGVVSHDKSGRRWFIQLTVRRPKLATRHPHPKRLVGVDVNVANLAATSRGDVFPSVRQRVAKWQRKVKFHERAMARRRGGKNVRNPSKRWLESKRCHARACEHLAEARKAYLHHVSAQLTAQFGVIAVEKLAISGMTRSAKGTMENPGKNVRAKAGLNREFLSNAPAELVRQLEYKAEQHGGHVVRVNAAYTSQTCNRCGHVDAANRRSQAVFRCVRCGWLGNADVNAARNIAARGNELRKQERACIGRSSKRKAAAN